MLDIQTGTYTQKDILIKGDEITAIEASITHPDATIIDADGQYAIPGLMDMHVHSLKMAPVLMHPLMIANGVTAVRDMGGCLGEPDAWVACADDKRTWTSEAITSARVSPRYDHITGLMINGTLSIPDSFDINLAANTAESARYRAGFDKARGLDFFKTYTDLPREGYFALGAAAKEHGMYMAGHLPFKVTAMEAIDTGQRSFEHAFLFIWECYPDITEVRKSPSIRGTYTDENRRRMIAEHDTDTCDALYEKMAETNTAIVPTHLTRRLDAMSGDPALKEDPRLKYIPSPLKMMWSGDADSMANRTTEAGLESYKMFYEFGIELTGRAHAAGVLVLAGTDAPDSYVIPGFGLIDELYHFERAGLSNIDILKTATLAPAQFLGLEGKAGEISVGARADVLLLDADPVRDIHNLDTLDSVIIAGTVYDKDKRKELLAFSEQAANHWSNWPKFVWQLLNSPITLKQFAD